MTLYEFILSLFPEAIQANSAYESYFVFGTLILGLLFAALLLRVFLSVVNIIFK